MSPGVYTFLERVGHSTWNVRAYEFMETVAWKGLDVFVDILWRCIC